MILFLSQSLHLCTLPFSVQSSLAISLENQTFSLLLEGGAAAAGRYPTTERASFRDSGEFCGPTLFTCNFLGIRYQVLSTEFKICLPFFLVVENKQTFGDGDGDGERGKVNGENHEFRRSVFPNQGEQASFLPLLLKSKHHFLHSSIILRVQI